MKKALLVFVGVVMGLLSVTSKVAASEGVVSLNSVGGSGVSCYASSVYVDGKYQVLLSCRNLRVPFSTEEDRYVLWAVDGETNVRRVGEVVRGKVNKSVSDSFSDLMITAERSSSPRKPSEQIVAQGELESLPVGENQEELIGGVVEKEVLRDPEPLIPDGTVIETGEVKVEEKSAVARFLGALGRIVLIGFLVLLGGVVIMTMVTRRKGRIK